MPTLIPLHSVTLARPHPKGEKDKEGNVKHIRVAPPVGKPFDFTPDEVKDLKASGHPFRTPRNEADEPVGSYGNADDADRVAAEAHAEATKVGGAPKDAAGTAKAGAKGKAKPKVIETGTAIQEADDNAQEASEVDEEEEL